mmetsp:Transcript_16633/g.28062  ORF Transcript_16633/g.28062 Transcript_16633/m.28062 type:complete len:139 (-) Transcript_16633:515-931(-)|eukprot:CAMPEP_0198207404 /NCGR_PEP_ID=MMETSP1445-20131203/10852_1 /TAXON_ID=36898 /ORGANISM="Pyramimonas sp., Strain CCMP2087" /LENGTH=138 /DNA_ID=CAMNT_0043880417 /DNA_START=98 /DNA_END=514 /DNA_ORIENTATION=-
MCDEELPFLSEPADTLRNGVGSLKQNALTVHPVEAIVKRGPQNERDLRRNMNDNIYGSAMGIREDLDRQILGRIQRLPGLPSARIGLESLTGKLDQFEFESYLGLSENSEVAPCADLHAVMDARLGFTKSEPMGRLGK